MPSHKWPLCGRSSNVHNSLIHNPIVERYDPMNRLQCNSNLDGIQRNPHRINGPRTLVTVDVNRLTTNVPFYHVMPWQSNGHAVKIEHPTLDSNDLCTPPNTSMFAVTTNEWLCPRSRIAALSDHLRMPHDTQDHCGRVTFDLIPLFDRPSFELAHRLKRI